MAQYRNLRSFAISLVIAIALTKSPARGFTIKRMHYTLPIPDLETGESVNLEVRHNLDETSKAIDREIIGLDTTVIAIKDPRADKKNTKGETVTPLSRGLIDSAMPMKRTEISQPSSLPTPKEFTSTRFSTLATSKVRTTTLTPKKIISSPSAANLTTLTSKTVTNLPVEKNTSTSDTPLDTTTKLNKNNSNYDNISTTESDLVYRNLKDFNKPAGKKQYIHVTNKFIESISSKVKFSDSKVNNSQDDKAYIGKENKDEVITFSESAPTVSETTTNTIAVELMSTTSSTDNEDSTEFDHTKSVTYIDITSTSSDNINDNSMVIDTQSTFDAVTEIANTLLDSTTNTYNTKTSPMDFSTQPIVPSWKQYTILDRKRTPTDGKTISHSKESPPKGMLREETVQTQISLENVLNSTPIPSLEKLKLDITNTEEVKTLTEAMSTTENIVMLEVSTSKIKTGTERGSKTTKLDVVSSKRAGFIDNTETSTRKIEEATTLITKKSSEKEMFGSMYENEGADVIYNKNATGVESQGQLVEDAIKEELLKEETINDNEENAKRYRDDMPSKIFNLSVDYGQNNDYPAEIATEDMLSVKPIGLDKKKASLYSAANYKPMKKIDIQPPNKFVRDPDDNSWRNESISSLGIVFKAKNASKSFTQVLKNKTESELASNTEKENKSGEVPDLKLRLEKIAEVRKSKKKRINKIGDSLYSDYEESSEENTNSTNKSTKSLSTSNPMVSTNTAGENLPSLTETDLLVNAIDKHKYNIFKYDEPTTTTVIPKSKKPSNSQDYYDTTDEYDADYYNLSKIDLKKFTQAKIKMSLLTNPPAVMDHTTAKNEYLPERKPTVQYFPPTTKPTQKVIMNDYDDGFKNRVNEYIYKDDPKNVVSSFYATKSPIPTKNLHEHPKRVTEKPIFSTAYRKEFDTNRYLVNPPATEPTFVNDGNFNRASYVIKHYRDFINEAVKENDGERGDYNAYTEVPLHGVTLNDMNKVKPKDIALDHGFDYESQYRKEILNRFVDNFNQNSERFKVDFPVLYNSSVVHGREPEHGKIASSSAFLKRLYDGSPRSGFLTNNKPPCTDAHCDNMTVELSPAYELHYYVPEQEEKEEFDPGPMPMPYQYRS